MSLQLFDSITFEVYISSVWVDITSDVLTDPPPRWNSGIMGTSPLDRVGDPEILTFSLRNGENNSAGLIGYYSPGHANALSGWTTGLEVRLTFTFEGTDYVKYRGRIQPDGITVTPGLKEERTVRVSCVGYMGQLADHDLNLLELAVEKRIDEVVPLIVANMQIAPASTSYETGASTFPTVFDTVSTTTKALGEFQKLAMSEFGFIYTKSDGTLKVESRTTRLNSTTNTSIPLAATESSISINEDESILLNEDGTISVLDEVTTAAFDDTMLRGMSVSYGADLANRLKNTAYPREVDAAATTVLYSLQKPIEIEAGETKTGIRGAYRDPEGGASYVNGRDMVTPVSGTDYAAFDNEDGSGSNRTSDLTVTATYGTAEVDYSLENTGATSLWVTLLQARGKGIYIYDPAVVVSDDLTSQSKHGIHVMSLDMKYQDDPLIADAIASYLLNIYANPFSKIEQVTFLANKTASNMMSFLYLEPGTRASFSETVTGINGDYFIMGYSAEIVAGKYVYWTPVVASSAAGGVWIWDTSTWDENTIWGFPQ